VRIKATLENNIDLEVQRAMFERAKEKMMSQFQDLTVSRATRIAVGSPVSRNWDGRAMV